MKDGTRSGLWTEFARIIDTLRPDWVVIENVRGLLSADANSNMEPCPLCVGDDPRHVLRALGAVLGDLAELGFDAEWTGIRASDIGAPHGRFRVFILAWPSENTGRGGSGRRAEGQEPSRGDDASLGSDQGRDGGRADIRLMPTPTAAIQTKSTRAMTASRENGRRSGGGQSSPLGLEETACLLVGSRPDHLPADSDLPPASREVVRALLPTPVAQPSGNTPEDHLRKKPGREVVTDLAIIAENGLIETGGRLLPTTTAMDANASGGSIPANKTLTDAIVRNGDVALLPTPTVGNATGGNAQLGGARGDEKLLPGLARDHATDWGPYESAIRRWEAIIGRPAPAPVRFDGKGGKPRLNPALCEWMMGWPVGHVTDPAIGLTRALQS